MAKRPSRTQEPELFSAASPAGTLAVRHRRVLFLPAYLLEEARQRPHLHTDEFERAHSIFREWIELEAKGVLARKETAIDADFLLRLFGDALGYRPVTEGSTDYELERQFSVPGVGTADGAIGRFSPSSKGSPVAVIELKSADVNIDVDRTRGRTPVQQCWDYLNALPDCSWGIVSNFVSFRLYHKQHGTRAFEHFKLEDLHKPECFREFFCVFGPGGFLPTKLQPEPFAERVLRLTGERQREVGDELYESYRSNRQALVHHLHARHAKPLDTAISIAQRLLDRIIFVAFCEDRGLLPDKIIKRTYEETPPLARVTNPRWRNFLDLFRAIDKGHKNLGLNGGYNGGLFKHDSEVDDLQLGDDWTDFFKSVGTYDFRDEVNVDVLGHLFEKSVTELERLRVSGLFAHESEDAAPRMHRSAQRKCFGIYYTPPEFTSFLVRHTLGEIVESRLADVARRHDLDPEAMTGDEPPEVLRAFWNDCLAGVRAIKVCDPACGSGAFLIAAYDYLEERYTDIIDNLPAQNRSGGDRLADDIPDLILGDNLFGVDLSPEAVEITQLALWIRSARRGRTLADLSQNIVCGNSLVDDPAVHTRPLRWKETFPRVFSGDAPGFDCVIGNPPWERLKLQEREFFALSAPKIAEAVSAAQRRKLIAKLESGNPELHARYVAAQEDAERVLSHARTCGRYPLAGKGDINTYALFAELAHAIVAPRGRVGLLVPSGIATDKTTKELFAELADSQALVSLYDFENRKGVFPDVHRSFKFSTLVFGGSARKTPAADFAFFAHRMRDLADKQRHIALSRDDLALVNPNTHTCPVFRTRRDAELTKQIYRQVPVLVDRTRKEGGNPWGVKFVRMFDQTNDAELFHTAEQLKDLRFKLERNRWTRRKRVFLPLYEAKMVQAFDHRAASVIVDEDNWVRQGQTVVTSLVAHQNPEFVVQPRWWVDQEEVVQAVGSGREYGFIGFKDITSPTNERTMIAAAIPRSAVTNHFPLVLTAVSPRLDMCLLANLNSFVLDYIARQKIGGVTLNFFIVEQLPILAPDTYAERCPWNRRQTLERWVSDRVLKLTCTANDMRPLANVAGFRQEVHKWKVEERARIRAELDAAYFLLYDVGRKDAEYVLSTFTGTQRRDTKDAGRFRTTELILNAYDALRA